MLTQGFVDSTADSVANIDVYTLAWLVILILYN